jgi:hypothetical protein
MSIELQIVALGCLSFLITVGADPIYWLKDNYNMLDWYIINCPKCFGYWLGFLVLVFQIGFVPAILGGAAVSIIGAIIESILLPRQ